MRARFWVNLGTSLDRWVTWDRVRAWSVILLAGYAAGWMALLLTLRHGLDPRGDPPGADFIIFYGVSRLTLAGKAALAYSSHALLMAERAVVPASRGVFLWCYPPTFQLVVWPLALMRYGVALAAWTLAGLALYLTVLRQISADRRLWLLALAFPGVFMNASQGQTGFLMAGLLGGGLLLLDTRPMLAGVLIGLLAIKPQFAVLTPLLIIVAGRWRALATAAVSSTAIALAATAAFGPQTWTDFIAASAAAGRALASGALPLHKDPSVFAALAAWGAPTAVALAIHAVSAAIAVALTILAWRRPGSAELKAALGVLGTLIVLPYLFDYDLAALAVPIAVGVKALHGREAPPGTRIGLIILAATPILVGPLGRWLHVPIGPAALWLGFFTLARILALDADLPLQSSESAQNAENQVKVGKQAVAPTGT